MYLVYIGESGNTGNSLNDSNQRHQVYSGLIIHENQYVSMSGEFNALCRRHLGEPLGRGDTPTQLKPADMYQGRGYFRSWSPDRLPPSCSRRFSAPNSPATDRRSSRTNAWR